MEMEDWDAFDLNDAPAKGKKRPRSDEMPEFETPEKKVAPLKIPKATKVPAISPVKRRVMDDMIHLKNLQNIQESGYLNVPAAPKTVQVPQHQPMYPSSAVVDGEWGTDVPSAGMTRVFRILWVPVTFVFGLACAATRLGFS